MNIEQAIASFYEACRRCVEAFKQVTKAFNEALQRAFSWFKQTATDIVDSFRGEDAISQKPPKLAYPQQSWAYYSKPQYRYKRQFRQEKQHVTARRNI